MTEGTIKSVCGSMRRNLPTIESISGKLRREMMEFSSVENVKKIVEMKMPGFLRQSSNGGELRDKIVGFFNERFPHMTVFGSVYSPVFGFDKHCTNADIRKFR